MMVIGGIVGFVLIASCREKFCRSAAGRRGRLFGSLSSWGRGRGRR